MKSIFSLLIIALCIGSYFVYIKPMTFEVKAMTAKKAELTDLLNRVKDIKEKRDSVYADYSSIPTDQIDRLNKVIPETFNSVLMLNDLSALSQKYNVQIKEFRVIDADSGNREEMTAGSAEIYKTTSVIMKVTGDYTQFISFLNELESGLSLIDLVNLQIRGNPSVKANQTSIEYTLEVKTYSLR